MLEQFVVVVTDNLVDNNEWGKEELFSPRAFSFLFLSSIDWDLTEREKIQ